MKKVVLAIVIFIAVVGGLILANRNNERAEFKKEVAEFATICKSSNYEWGNFKSLEFKDSVLTMDIAYNSNYMPKEVEDIVYKMYETDPQIFSQSMTYFLSSMFVKILEDKTAEKFYNHLKMYASKINFNAELPSGTIIFTTSDMDSVAELTDKFRDNPDDALRYALLQRISMEKANLPMQLDEMTTAIDEFLEGDMLVYVCEIDENQVSISDIKQCSEYIKRTILNNPSIRNNLKQFNVDIAYRYIGNISGDTYDIILRQSDLY